MILELWERVSDRPHMRDFILEVIFDICFMFDLCFRSGDH